MYLVWVRSVHGWWLLHGINLDCGLRYAIGLLLGHAHHWWWWINPVLSLWHWWYLVWRELLLWIGWCWGSHWINWGINSSHHWGLSHIRVHHWLVRHHSWVNHWGHTRRSRTSIPNNSHLHSSFVFRICFLILWSSLFALFTKFFTSRSCNTVSKRNLTALFNGATDYRECYHERECHPKN